MIQWAIFKIIEAKWGNLVKKWEFGQAKKSQSNHGLKILFEPWNQFVSYVLFLTEFDFARFFAFLIKSLAQCMVSLKYSRVLFIWEFSALLKIWNTLSPWLMQFSLLRFPFIHWVHTCFLIFYNFLLYLAWTVFAQFHKTRFFLALLFPQTYKIAQFICLGD